MAFPVVLVHGGFHGGWCWQKVAVPLRRRGWDVYAPSLSGTGDRAHLLSAGLTQDHRVQDIVRLIEFEDLNDVILCGHSAGGMIITGVAQCVPERISHLIYLDAAVPKDGQGLLDVLDDHTGLADAFHTSAAAHGDGWRIPASILDLGVFGVTDAADLTWMATRMTDESLPLWTEPMTVKGDQATYRKTFVRAEQFALEFNDRQFEEFAADPGWQVESWDTGHNVMMTVPERVISLLVGERADGRTPSSP